VKVILVEV